MQERLAIAGAGTIACGIAAIAAHHGDVLLWARSETSAERATSAVAKHHAKLPEPLEGLSERVKIVTELEELAGATYIVEAVVEDRDHKAALLADLASVAAPETVLATTTSSLSIGSLAVASGRPEWFAGLHVFNPVPRMELVELTFPSAALPAVRSRTRALCEALGKTGVEVPDIPGFVVNRLLFPYLFSAVDLLSQTAMAPADLDRCMTLGASLPMGPIALLDYVGLDVAAAIGQEIGARVPPRLTELVRSGALGRKSKRGFYEYD